MRTLILMLITPLCVFGAERTFTFADAPLDQAPPGFVSVAGGDGAPGVWKVIMDQVPPVMEPLTTKAVAIAERPVLAQTGRSQINEHFPMLIADADTYGDFRFSTRFKIETGAVAQMAGIVFRYQDEKNYYVLLASALDNRLWFSKFVNGQRGLLIGPEVKLERGKWYEIAVECQGNHIRCYLDGKETIPMLSDPSFTTGKVGFWTKSDSVTYFADARLTYTPRELHAQRLVSDALKEYPRVLDLQVFAAPTNGGPVKLVAARAENELGQLAGETELAVLSNGVPRVGKGKGFIAAVLPLRDRNGEPIAAVRVVMTTFLGETQDNAAVRAQPIVKKMQSGVQTHAELFQ